MISIDDTNIECTKQFTRYTLVKKASIPYIVVGFLIKRVFDNDRLKIKPGYNPVRKKHLTKHFDGANEWCCVYGVEVDTPVKIKHLYHTLITTPSPSPELYRDIVNMHGFSCDENSLLMRQNMIVLNSKCLSEITDQVDLKTFDSLRKMMVTQPKYPWYSNWSDFKIFIMI
jgi:hypothetical protein